VIKAIYKRLPEPLFNSGQKEENITMSDTKRGSRSEEDGFTGSKC